MGDRALRTRSEAAPATAGQSRRLSFAAAAFSRPFSGRGWRGKLLRGALVAALGGALLLGSAWLALPLVSLPVSLFTPPARELDFVDRFGAPLRTVKPGDDVPYARQATYAQIPLPLVQATIAAEDHRFWRHPGVDWRALLRAAGQLAWHRRVVSGGSTITQQLIKLAQPRPRTLRAKLIEAAQALRLEQVWDKPTILTAYLNRLNYGNFNTGCAEAADYYFGKPLSHLSAAECALLAGLPQAPARLNPHRHLERAQKRQRWILREEVRGGSLTAEEAGRALKEPLRFTAPRRVFEAPHFVDLLIRNQNAERRMQSAGGTNPPAVVRTTLDLELNRFAETAVRRQLDRLRDHRAHDAAVVVLENRSGEVLALVGSGDYFAPGSGQVNGAWAPRSAGSTFKPFTYLLALERGATCASVAADVPSEFATATGLFAPVNYNRHCAGPVRYRLALANSLNLPAVKVLASLGGPEPLLRRLRDCGLTTLTQRAEDYGLGLTIGNAEARLLELANAYACLARLGEYRPCRLFQDEPIRPPVRLAGMGESWLVADILADNGARAAAFGTDTPLRFDFPVACKTGTSSNFRDNWAFGYTPEFTVGVWVGNFDATPMEDVSGISGAGPILHELFAHLNATHGTGWYSPPAGLVETEVDALTGKLLQPGAAVPGRATVREKFLPGALPPPATAADYDAAGRVRLAGEYREWLAGPDNWLGERAVLADGTSAPRILFPPPGTTFFLDPDLPHHGGRVTLRAEGSPGLRWESPSLRFETGSDRTVVLLAEGRHELTVSDPRTGAKARTWIEVIAR